MPELKNLKNALEKTPFLINSIRAVVAYCKEILARQKTVTDRMLYGDSDQIPKPNSLFKDMQKASKFLEDKNLINPKSVIKTENKKQV